MVNISHSNWKPCLRSGGSSCRRSRKENVMNANEFATFVVGVIKGESEEIMQYIQDEDWEGLEDEFYYALCNAEKDK